MDNASIGKTISILGREVAGYDVPVVDLVKVQTEDPFKVLIATMLSAQTKDNVTAGASKRLFSKVKGFEDLDRLSAKDIEKLIYPVSFYRTKARHLRQVPGIIKKDFKNKIPQAIGELIKIPGVGRKTANLVMAVGFGKLAICVDTHVHRIMNRLGYVNTRNPFETEMALRKKLPKRYWLTVNRILVAFGQNLCTPISPHCSRCPVRKYCDRAGVGKSR